MDQEHRRAKARRYNASRKGVARNLRCEHGMDRETSLYWADALLHPFTQCAICGLPNMMLRVYKQRGWPWFLGKRDGAGSHPHLTLDHVVPGKLEGGFRPLCSACNSTRGAEQFSDEEVLQIIRDKWLWFTGIRFLWWLNDTPGKGGRLHRSLLCERREDALLENLLGGLDEGS